MNSTQPVVRVRLSLAVAVLACLCLGAEERMSDNAGVLRIFLARHGETDWNKGQRVQGSTDMPLNEKGRRQAQLLAERMRGIRLDRIYCSTLLRSRTTAEALTGYAPIEAMAGLREQSLGRFEGKVMDGSDPQARSEYHARIKDANDSMTGGESRNQHRERVHETLAVIRGRHPTGTILIVGHGGTNALILRELLSLSDEESGRVRQANDELFLIELWPGVAPKLLRFVDRDSLVGTKQ